MCKHASHIGTNPFSELSRFVIPPIGKCTPGY